MEVEFQVVLICSLEEDLRLELSFSASATSAGASARRDHGLVATKGDQDSNQEAAPEFPHTRLVHPPNNAG
jgi:hypothetical protein